MRSNHIAGCSLICIFVNDLHILYFHIARIAEDELRDIAYKFLIRCVEQLVFFVGNFKSYCYLKTKLIFFTLFITGRVFAQEWAKFRWGVFEEYGHPDDPLYPTFYRTDVRTQAPTGCSNHEVIGLP